VLGVAYKRDIEDVRESPALDIIQLLLQRGASVTFSDPHVNRIHVDGTSLQSQETVPGVETADCVVILTNHSDFDYAAIVDRSKLIVDTRNALKSYQLDKIVRL
jgi:UDP-N-acetyl-D-glucosamine dehydrogenase